MLANGLVGFGAGIAIGTFDLLVPWPGAGCDVTGISSFISSYKIASDRRKKKQDEQNLLITLNQRIGGFLLQIKHLYIRQIREYDRFQFNSSIKVLIVDANFVANCSFSKMSKNLM